MTGRDQAARAAFARRRTMSHAAMTMLASSGGAPVSMPPPACRGRIFRRWTSTPWSSSTASPSPSMPPTATAPGESSPYRIPAAAASSSASRWTTCPPPLPACLVIDSAVVVLALALLAGAAWWIVRSSLRPLEEVEATAEAIAAGDLARRVPQRDPRTEVGRLSTALNAMLGQIEAAFEARRASETAARATAEKMRRFVADASHELRTPLTSIRGFSELYRQGAVGDDAALARVMRRIEDESIRMGLLVEDLLLLARLDQQRPLESKPVDLVPLVTDAVLDARAVATDHEVRLRVDTEAASAVVVGDELRLRQVVGNLVSNAVRHTPANTVVVVGLAPGPAGQVVLEVSDDGPGLSSEDASRVFERFYRADPSRTRTTGGGNGLGLSIVAGLVSAHQGSVEAAPTPGGGATFRVLLPRVTTPITG